MKTRTMAATLCLVTLFVFLAPLRQTGRAADEAPAAAARSVEERRLQVAIEEQRQRLQEKEEKLQQKELELKTLETEVDKKLDELRQAREEASALLARKSEAENRRLRDLSAMYEKMAPDKSAALLAGMEESLAVDILGGMKSKTAGRVLGSMERGKAAKLTKAYSQL